MSRFWRTISRSGRKRVQVRSHGRPVPIHNNTVKGDGSGVVEFAIGTIITIWLLCLLFEALPWILVFAVIGVFLALCLG